MYALRLPALVAFGSRTCKAQRYKLSQTSNKLGSIAICSRRIRHDGKEVIKGAVPDFWGLPTRVRDIDEVRSPKAFKDVAANNWVSDAAGVLSPEQTAEVNRLLTKLHRELGVETAIVTLNEITSVPDPDSPRLRMWCVELFNHWGVGDGESSNGLMMVLLKDQRRLESVMGLGLEEVLPAAFLEDVQRAVMVPLLKNGLYGEALLAGVRECNAKIRQEARGVRWLKPPEPKLLESGDRAGDSVAEEASAYRGGKAPRPVLGPGDDAHGNSGNDKGGSGGQGGRRLPFLLAGGATGFFLMQALASSSGKKKCKKCGGDLKDLPASMVARLDRDPCTLMEQELDSARYLYCPAQWGPGGTLDTPATYGHGGERPTVVKVPRGGRFDLCPKCNCICLERTESMVRSPTYDTDGVKTVTQACRRCNYTDSRSESISKLRPAETSSTTGSTYGGGASGGGGASSSF